MLQPEEPQYGRRTKRRLDERTASRYRQEEAQRRRSETLDNIAAREVFDRVRRRPQTFFYEQPRGLNQPFGAPSEEINTVHLPRLLALGVIMEETRLWTSGMDDWEEWQYCRDRFELPDTGPGSVQHATAELDGEAAAAEEKARSDGWTGLGEDDVDVAAGWEFHTARGQTNAPDVDNADGEALDGNENRSGADSQSPQHQAAAQFRKGYSAAGREWQQGDTDKSTNASAGPYVEPRNWNRGNTGRLLMLLATGMLVMDALPGTMRLLRSRL